MVSSVPSIRCTTRKLGSTVGAVFWRGSQVLQEDILVDLRSLPLPILKPPTYILYCSLLSNFFQVFGCIAFAVNTSFFPLSFYNGTRFWTAVLSRNLHFSFSFTAVPVLSLVVVAKCQQLSTNKKRGEPLLIFLGEISFLSPSSRVGCSLNFVVGFAFPHSLALCRPEIVAENGPCLRVGSTISGRIKYDAPKGPVLSLKCSRKQGK